MACKRYLCACAYAYACACPARSGAIGAQIILIGIEVAYLLLICAGPVYAEAPFEHELNKVEFTLLGTNRTGRPLLDRVEYLEKYTWGESHRGGLLSRIEALENCVGTNPVQESQATGVPLAPGAPLPGFNEIGAYCRWTRNQQPSTSSNKEEMPAGIAGQSTESAEKSKPEPQSAEEFNNQEIEAINAQAQNENLSPADQAALEATRKQQQGQAVKRKAAAAAGVMAIGVGRMGLNFAVRNAMRW